MLAGAVTATVPLLIAFVVVRPAFLGRFRGAGWLGR
jgi:hypothetical protein